MMIFFFGDIKRKSSFRFSQRKRKCFKYINMKFEALPRSSRKRNVRIWRHFFHVFVGKT